MDSHTRYATSADGTRIAFRAAGQGYPVLVVSPLFATIETFWRPAIAGFAPGFRPITYDRRGVGMSDREVERHGPEAQIEDILAVADALELNRFALSGSLLATLEVVPFAARYPERVSALILRSPVARYADWWGRPVIRAGFSSLEHDWEWFTEAMGQWHTGWGNPRGPEFAAQIREMTSQQAVQDILKGLTGVDVSGDLAALQAPALVIHANDQGSAISYARRIAAAIPRAEITSTDRFLIGAHPSWIAPTVHFLEEHAQPESPPAGHTHDGLRTIMFTDVESSTALTQRLGDEAAQQVMRGHNAAVRRALAEHDGHEVKHTGDGIMAWFPSAARAVDAALQVQRELAHGEVRVRIGLNTGEPLEEDGDLFGAAVQLAARICAQAEPGQTLVSNVVRELCAGKGMHFTSIGAMELKGFIDPVPLYAVSRP